MIDILICVDGPDGSGKSTLIAGLKDELDLIQLTMPRIGEFKTDEERVVCQQVTTKVGYLLSHMRQKFIVDRLMLSNLVYNEAGNRKDSFDYVGELKNAGPVILITLRGQKEEFMKKRKDMFRPVPTNPVNLYDKYITELKAVIPVCELRAYLPKEELVQLAKEFICMEETKLREKESLDSIFMALAETMSTRSSCLRHHVGAVLVKSNTVVSMGYNGAPSGVKHCIEVGCLRKKMAIPSGTRTELCRGAHAEANAIIQAARNNVSTTGAVIYSTSLPCAYCCKVIINAKIAKVFYKREYGDTLGKQLLEEAGIQVIKMP